MPEDVKFAGLWGGQSSYWRIPEFFGSLGVDLERFETIIHPRAYVSPQSSIGRGTVILAGTTVAADVRVGDWVGLLQNVTLSHDDVVEDYTFVTSGATFSGIVRVGYNCFIGTNSTIVDKARIGAQCLIGAGALVRHDVPDREIWVGNPARRLCSLDEWRQRKGYA
jgi:sugar O-acyltransferase (sialic acid O-acetyltransferase NeuD family)